jgi:hypothetical protein
MTEVIDTSEKLEEVYIPASPPETTEITPNNEFTESTSSTKKIVRYYNTLYELRLIVKMGRSRSLGKLKILLAY